MTLPSTEGAHIIWATRGRNWGFRFLLDAGISDPLPEYERAFAGLGDTREGYVRSGDTVAFRFPDPAGRRDASGRPIPHEFVVLGQLTREINSANDGVAIVWPLVEQFYARVWDSDRPPVIGMT